MFDRGFPKDNPRTVLYNGSGERFANPQAFVGGGGAFPGRRILMPESCRQDEFTQMIRITNLRKRFGSQVAVDDLSLQINAGETFGLLGPNGAGKTTTISMIVGYLNPDHGVIEVGHSADRCGPPQDADFRKLIGIAPQTLSLYDELTANENLEFFARLYGLNGSALRTRREWGLEFSGLVERQCDRVGTFSGGMKRRLNLAVAMMHQPGILLLDEPTVGVDPQSRHYILDCIQQLSSTGVTIVYTTHSMAEMQRLADRVAIIDHGRMIALDTVPRLIASHGGKSVVTAKLRRAAGVSLPGTVDADQLRFESDDPVQAVAALKQQGVDFQTLQIAQPDLESVFLKLTGRSLRDE